MDNYVLGVYFCTVHSVTNLCRKSVFNINFGMIKRDAIIFLILFVTEKTTAMVEREVII